MEIILRVFQVFLAIGLIGVVLLQRSEGGGLGIGSSGGAGSFMSVRGTANFLTRLTAILAALFMVTCLALALLAKPSTTASKSIFDVPASTPAVPRPPVSDTPAIPAPAAPAAEAPAPVAQAPIVVPPASTGPAAAAPAATPAVQPAVPVAKDKVKKAPQTGTPRTPGQ